LKTDLTDVAFGEKPENRNTEKKNWYFNEISIQMTLL
jgi:hypothetical protein